MLTLCADGAYRSDLLGSIPGLQHAFGTKQTGHFHQIPDLITLKQIHSNQVVLVRGQGDGLPEADALVTDRPNVLLGVKTADCVPILLVDPVAQVVAAVHAGWRGTVNAIAVRTLEVMEQAGADRKRVLAAIGPSIGHCCFEVGPEVARMFLGIFPERLDLDTRTYIDLQEANRRLLIEAEISITNIDFDPHCTVCEATVLHSHRREREQAGRQLSVIGY